MTGERTREQAVDRAAVAYAHMLATVAEMTPREQAEAAWSPGCPSSMDELEDRIRIRRGMAPVRGDGAA